jgi:anti-sigma regulatory factor (Ser/Thr protein kinase)
VTGQLLASFGLASVPGNERLAIERVRAAVADLGLSEDSLDRLGTAVGETVMNAIEHGHHDHAEMLVEVEVRYEAAAVVVTVTDHGGASSATTGSAEPDLELKLAGEQSPRGWGLFLIRHMVDQMTVETVGRDHTVRLVVDGAPGRQEERL